MKARSWSGSSLSAHADADADHTSTPGMTSERRLRATQRLHSKSMDHLYRPRVGPTPGAGHHPPPAQMELNSEAIVDDPPGVGRPASSADIHPRPMVDPGQTSPSPPGPSSPGPLYSITSPSMIPLPPSPPPPLLVRHVPPPPPPPPLLHPLPRPTFAPGAPPPPPPPPPAARHNNDAEKINLLTITQSAGAYRFHPLPVDASPRRILQHLDVDVEDLPEEMSIYSETRRRPESSSTSDYLTFDDAIIYENSRHFPPRLPTAPPFSKEHSRTSARKKIHSWIARYESSQGTKSDPIFHHGATFGLDNDDDDRSSTFSYPSASSSDVEIEDLWRLMKSKRSQINELRGQLVRKRREIKSLRRMKDDADNNFMTFVRRIMVNKESLQHSTMPDLERRMFEMQSLRDEYQDLETSCEDLEDGLDKEEEHLHQIELRFFSLLGTGEYAEDLDYPSQGPEKGPQDLVDVPVELLGISSDKPLEDLHPHFVDLTLAIASLQNEREELSNLLDTKKQCDAEVEVKNRVGQKIPRDIVEFLSDFRAQEAMKQDEVASNESEVRRLRQLCEQKDIMGKHLSIHMAMALDPSLEFEDLRLNDEAAIIATHETLAHDRFPVLLSQPDHLLATAMPILPQDALTDAQNLPEDDPQKPQRLQFAEKEHEIQQLLADIQTDDGKAGFINRWLLHSLRTTPLNTNLLHSTFMIECQGLRIIDPSRWQNDVLWYWWEDDTAATTAHFDEIDRGSQYYSRVGTPPPTRAASEALDTVKAPHSHRRTWSSGPKTSQTL